GTDDRAVDVTGQIAGNEHENLCGIAEAVIAQRQPGDDVVRNVIQEDHPQPDAAEKIEPEVALDPQRRSKPPRIGHDVPLHFVLWRAKPDRRAFPDINTTHWLPLVNALASH